MDKLDETEHWVRDLRHDMRVSRGSKFDGDAWRSKKDGTTLIWTYVGEHPNHEYGVVP